MADKRISQLVERVDIANDDVLPIVASGATTTNKVTVSTLQDWMQENLDVGVTSVGITIGSTGTDVNVTGSPVTSSGNITINLPTASATNRGLLSAADWVTFNSKQDAGSFVTLDTAQTITAQKTFTTSGSSDTMIISHGSGSGFALDVLKAGNGEAIRVTKTSGSGNAMTISGGNFEAGTIVKTGGTSSQFLKADGSVDSNAYTTNTGTVTSVGLSSATSGVTIGSSPITTSGTITLAIATASGSQNGLLSSTDWTTFNGKQSALNGTGFVKISGTTISYDNSTYLTTGTAASTYLPLTGGTLTGALNGTSASFSSTTEASSASTASVILAGGLGVAKNIRTAQNIIAEGVAGTIATLNGGDFQIYTSGNANYSSISSPSSGNMVLKVNIGATPINALTLASTGEATFSSSVTAATLSTIGTAVAATNVQLNLNGVSGKAQRIEFQHSGVQQWLIGCGASSETNAFEIFNSTGANSLSINKSTNEATFSSSVKARNGTSGVAFETTNAVDADFIIETVAGGTTKIGTSGNALGINVGGGSVGIGTTSPSAILDVIGTTGAIFRYDSSSTYINLLPEDANGSVKIKFGANGGAAPDLLFVNDGNSEIARFRNSGGITFNGDTAAANALDDYEEGTWTPTVTAESGSYTTIFSPRGTYTKIGRVVTLTYYFQVNNKGTGSNACILSSLPFASKSSSSGDTYVGSGIQNSSNNPNQIVLAQNSSSLYIYENTGDPITATLPNTGTITYIT